MKLNKQVIRNIYPTNEGYSVQVIDYIDRHNVLVNFMEKPDYQVWSTMQNIRKGQIKNPYHKSVYNIGYYGDGLYTARLNNIKTPQYVKWFSMFNRCYNEKFQEKQPSYIGCTVDENFHNFQHFAQWYDKRIYKCNYPLELDKDLLVSGNTVYAPHTCCFIPKEINNIINYKRSDKVYMTKIYDKYKSKVPYYIRMKLLDLTRKD